MNPRLRAAAQVLLLIGAIAVLLFIFPRAFAFVEMATRELLYLWWLILLVALALWFLWAANRRPK